MVNEDHMDDNYGSAFHALLMAGTFVVLFPLGVLWKRIFERLILHWLNQVIGVFAVIVGAGVGVYVSRMYNKVRLGLICSKICACLKVFIAIFICPPLS